MRTMQEVIKYRLFLYEKAVKYLFIACRKVLCVSCWNGSKTCVIEASQCKKILGEVVGGPLLLVPTTVIGNAAMPVVVEQPTAATLAATVGSPERVEEEEKQREVEK